MATTVDILRARAILGRDMYRPPKPFGPNGWILAHRREDGTVIVSADWFDGVEYVHASMTRSGRIPCYDDMCRLYRAAYPPGGWAYQVFAPPSHHINIHEFALHLWGRADGSPALPNFAENGSI